MNESTFFRDTALEKNLQTALEEGHRVWVVGDVHGFHQTMRALLDRLNLCAHDWVVFLGDLIDRGPNSFGVLQTIREHPNMTSVLGNHEAMMLEQFHADRLAMHDMDVALWWRNGGASTVFSYERAFGLDGDGLDEVAMHERVDEDRAWLATLPRHIVLEKWRLVHAGYRPGQSPDDQTDDDYLWIRRPFHEASEPVDAKRTVIFGHTPTAALPGFSIEDWGKVWYSTVVLEDGRSAAIGVDTCLFHGQDGAHHLTAFDLQTGEVVHQARVEPRSP
ncbi:MAG: metallophosphoesterase [Poseidonia sp.]|jgi:serine/threonine protein phosphatase 1